MAASTSGTRSNPASLRKFTGAAARPDVHPGACGDAARPGLRSEDDLLHEPRRQPRRSARCTGSTSQPTQNLPDFVNLGGTEDGRPEAAAARRRQRRPDRRPDHRDQARQRQRAGGADLRRRRRGLVVRDRLDPDGRSFWAQTNGPGNVYRFNIASGAVDAARSRRRQRLRHLREGHQDRRVRQRRAERDDHHARRRRDLHAGPDGQRRLLVRRRRQRPRASTSCTGQCLRLAHRHGFDRPKTLQVDAPDLAGDTASKTTTYTVVAPPPPPPPPPPAWSSDPGRADELHAARRPDGRVASSACS